MRSGAFLVECSTEKASSALRQRDGGDILSVPIKVSVHGTLNSSRGVIRCRELEGLTETEICSELKSQGVLKVHRVVITKDSKKVPTNTLFLTFAMPTLPESIRIGYLRVKVSPFVPAPLRCFQCQRFGHSSHSCRGKATCRLCGQAKHEGTCSTPIFCVNCQGNHPAHSKSCPVWKKEAEIQKVKAERKCSFTEARRIVELHVPPRQSSYSAVASSGPAASSGSYTSGAQATPSVAEKKLDDFMSTVLARLSALEQSVADLVQGKQCVSPPSVPAESAPATHSQGRTAPSKADQAVDSSQVCKDSRSSGSSVSHLPIVKVNQSHRAERRSRSASRPASSGIPKPSFGEVGFLPGKHGRKKLQAFSGLSASNICSVNRFDALSACSDQDLLKV